MTEETYESCVACYARLLIDSPELPVESISRTVGVKNTKLTLVNQSQFDLIGPGMKLKEAKWLLSSENRVNSVDLRDHLDWLLERLNPVASALSELQKSNRVKMLLDCVMFFKGGGVPKLRPDQMRTIGELNLALSFDFYFLREPEDDEGDEEEEGQH